MNTSMLVCVAFGGEKKSLLLQCVVTWGVWFCDWYIFRVVHRLVRDCHIDFVLRGFEKQNTGQNNTHREKTRSLRTHKKV
jgi:hypothetical protein